MAFKPSYAHKRKCDLPNHLELNYLLKLVDIEIGFIINF